MPEKKLTDEDCTSLYNAVLLAEKLARGKEAKAVAAVGVRTAIKLGLAHAGQDVLVQVGTARCPHGVDIAEEHCNTCEDAEAETWAFGEMEGSGERTGEDD